MAVCTTVMPPVSADSCDLNAVAGQISRIYFTRNGDGLTSVTDDAEWTTRISNSAAMVAEPSDSPIRYLFVIGQLPEPEQTEIEVSLARKYYSDPKFTLSFEVDDTSATNYSVASCLVDNNGAIYSCWFYNEGYIFGGNDGITATMKLSFTIPQSRTELRKILGTLTWEGSLPQMDAIAFIPEGA